MLPEHVQPGSQLPLSWSQIRGARGLSDAPIRPASIRELGSVLRFTAYTDRPIRICWTPCWNTSVEDTCGTVTAATGAVNLSQCWNGWMANARRVARLAGPLKIREVESANASRRFNRRGRATRCFCQLAKWTHSPKDAAGCLHV